MLARRHTHTTTLAQGQPPIERVFGSENTTDATAACTTGSGAASSGGGGEGLRRPGRLFNRRSVADAAKGRGVGRFAIEQVAAEARRRGVSKITVLWEPAPDGPEEFYLRLGFRKTGELFGEVVGELDV